MSELYPCKECILLGNCSEYCDKLIEKGIELLRHMILRGNCPDCGGEKSFLNFSHNGSDNGPVRQFNIMCYECFCCISVWMNLERTLNVTLHSFTKQIVMPSIGRRVASRRVNSKVDKIANIDYTGRTHIILTTYNDAINGYIIPRIEYIYCRVPYELWEQGKWEEEV